MIRRKKASVTRLSNEAHDVVTKPILKTLILKGLKSHAIYDYQNREVSKKIKFEDKTNDYNQVITI